MSYHHLQRQSGIKTASGERCVGTSNVPANTGHSPNAVSMLAHRLRRWPNIETALGECPVFAGITTASLSYKFVDTKRELIIGMLS